MNLLALRNEVLAHGFDPIQYGSRVTQYINDGYQLIAARVEYYVEEATQTVVTVPGMAFYNWLPDLGRMRSIFDADRHVEMFSVDPRQIDRSSESSGPPAYYALFGAGIELFPNPDNVYTLLLRYWKVPALLVADTDEPTLPLAWHKLLWEYATQQCFEADDDPTMGQYWGTKFAQDLSMFAADVKFPDTDRAHKVAGMWGQDENLSTSTGWGFWGVS